MWPKIGQSRGPSNIYTNWVISNCFHLRSSKNKRWCLDSDRALQLGCHASTWDTKPGRVHDPNWFELQTKTLKTQGLSYSSVVQHLHNIDKALGPIPSIVSWASTTMIKKGCNSCSSKIQFSAKVSAEMVVPKTDVYWASPRTFEHDSSIYKLRSRGAAIG